MAQRVDWKDFLSLETVAEKLKSGEVVAGSSDTVLGLLSAATTESKKKLDQIKQRSDMPYLILVPDVAAAQKLSPLLQSGKVAQLARAFWPGPLTLILPAGKDVPQFLQSSSGGIAVRVPDHAGLQRLLAQCEMLFSTSANRSGDPVPERFSEIDPAIMNQVAFLIEDEGKKKVVPSTILDCTKEGIEVVREGAISKERLQAYL